VAYQTAEQFLCSTGEFSWLLDDLQYDIREKYRCSPAIIHWFNCSRQVGKSFLAVCLALEYLVPQMKLLRIARVYSATLGQVSDIVNDNMSKILAECPMGLVERMKSENRWRVGRAQLRLGTMERAHVDKNRGGGANLVIYEETGFLPSEDAKYAIESVVGPQLLRAAGVRREVHVSTPSEDEFHYLHTVIGPKVKNLKSYHEYDIDKSPSITPQMRQEAVERSGGEDSEAWRREYKCQVIRTQSRMLFPEFDETKHVKIFELPKFYEAILMIDGGGVRDKTGIVIGVFDFHNQRLLITNEAELPRGTGSAEIVTTARFLENEIIWRGEPNRWADLPGLTSIDFNNEHNYFVRLPHKDNRDANIAATRVRINNDRLWVHPRCTRLISCMKAARWDKHRKEIERTDEHGHADLAVSLVYADRMIDRATNPYPAEVIDRDTKLHLPYRSKNQDTDLQAVAKNLVPFSPMERARGRR
jgi:hypothetical protein